LSKSPSVGFSCPPVLVMLIPKNNVGELVVTVDAALPQNLSGIPVPYLEPTVPVL